MGNRISRLDPRAFAAASIRAGLQRLYLGSNALDDAGVSPAAWTALGRLRALEALDLSGNPALKEVHSGLDALWNGRGGGGGGDDEEDDDDDEDDEDDEKNLRVLDLRGTGVTEASLASSCPSLMRAAAAADEQGGGGVEVFLTGGVGGCYGAFGGAARGGDGGTGGGGGGGAGNSSDGGGGDGVGGVGWPGGLAPGEEPPLEHQLAALTTVELQNRLRDYHWVVVDPARSRRPGAGTTSIFHKRHTRVHTRHARFTAHSLPHVFQEPPQIYFNRVNRRGKRNMNGTATPDSLTGGDDTVVQPHAQTPRGSRRAECAWQGRQFVRVFATV